MIKYDPVAGLEIVEAIERAKHLASQSNDIVWANINDIVLIITKDTNIKSCYLLYKEQKLREMKQLQR